MYQYAAEPLLKNTLSVKGYTTLSIKDQFCGPHKTMAILAGPKVSII